MPNVPRVVFVCLHGSAKSQIAAAHLRKLATERGVLLDVESLGIEPDAVIPPAVVDGLRSDGAPLHDPRPRAATRARIRGAVRVVSFACDVSEIIPPGVDVERWDDVPAVSDGYAAARDAIVSRLPALMSAAAHL
ncbi:MAG: arsenate reductase/protein-tyrosine-phosphatase family protein [Gemmatimonadaceae bacterium]